MDSLNDRKTIRPQFIGGIPGHVEDADYYYLETTPHTPTDLVVCYGGWEQCASDFVIHRTNYPYWFMIYVTEGLGELQAGDQHFTLHPGTLTGFTPRAPHRYQSDPSQPMEQIFVTFQGTEATTLLEQCGLTKTPALRVSDPPSCLTLFEQLLQTGLEHGQHAQTICGHLLRAILLKVSQGSPSREVQRPGAWQTFQTCQRYLNDHFTLLHTPIEAAEACGIDVRYMAALFKRFGTASPQQYLLRLKMSRAADLLLTTPLAIKEIARRVGFEDPYHFSRRFKQAYGCAPKQYRITHL